MATKRAPDQLPDPKKNMWDFTAFYLRLCRNQRGLSVDALGRTINMSKSKLSRIELGDERLDGRYAAQLDRAWDTGGLFELLVWYAAVGHDPQWFAQYVELEQAAGMLRIFEAQVIPGLLQSEDYSRALLLAGMSTQPEKILTERMQRQAVLTREPAPYLTVLLSQNVLEWPVGSPTIMREQLGRLLEVSELPNVVVRVAPRSWETGAYPGLDGSFALMSGDDYGDVAYTESPGGGRLVSSPSDVRHYGIRYDRISAKALPEGPSRTLIKNAMEAVSE